MFTFGLLLLNVIKAERTRLADLSAAARRTLVHDFLDNHRSETSKSGFYFDGGSREKPACMIGYSVRTDFPAS